MDEWSLLFHSHSATEDDRAYLDGYYHGRLQSQEYLQPLINQCVDPSHQRYQLANCWSLFVLGYYDGLGDRDDG